MSKNCNVAGQELKYFGFLDKQSKNNLSWHTYWVEFDGEFLSIYEKRDFPCQGSMRVKDCTIFIHNNISSNSYGFEIYNLNNKSHWKFECLSKIESECWLNYICDSSVKTNYTSKILPYSPEVSCIASRIKSFVHPSSAAC